MVLSLMYALILFYNLFDHKKEKTVDKLVLKITTVDRLNFFLVLLKVQKVKSSRYQDDHVGTPVRATAYADATAL